MNITDSSCKKNLSVEEAMLDILYLHTSRVILALLFVSADFKTHGLEERLNRIMTVIMADTYLIEL